MGLVTEDSKQKKEDPPCQSGEVIDDSVQAKQVNTPTQSIGQEIAVINHQIKES